MCFDTRTCRQLQYALLRTEKDEKGLGLVILTKIRYIMNMFCIMEENMIRQGVAISCIDSRCI